jgi:hypothetical protein
MIRQKNLINSEINKIKTECLNKTADLLNKNIDYDTLLKKSKDLNCDDIELLILLNDRNNKALSNIISLLENFK